MCTAKKHWPVFYPEQLGVVPLCDAHADMMAGQEKRADGNSSSRQRVDVYPLALFFITKGGRKTVIPQNNVDARGCFQTAKIVVTIIKILGNYLRKQTYISSRRRHWPMSPSGFVNTKTPRRKSTGSFVF